MLAAVYSVLKPHKLEDELECAISSYPVCPVRIAWMD